MKQRFGLVLPLLAALTLPMGASCAPAEATTASAGLHWFKGNTHTHTNRSDGDSSPAVVARWYRDHGYDFLVISDHNKLVDPAPVMQELGEDARGSGRKPFLLIPGEEVTDSFKAGARSLPLHINAIGTTQTVGARHGASTTETVANDIAAIHATGGLSHVNHPNFGWALTLGDLMELPAMTHMEIFNGHPTVNNWGGGGRPGAEEMWDALLTAGHRILGMATDDAHNYADFVRTKANPGRGWIVVRAAALEPDAVIAAIREGRYYASTGVAIDDITTTDSTLGLKISPAGSQLYTTQFIGRNGDVLATDASLQPSYRLKSGDAYVRARVRSSNGGFAWTQPLHAAQR